MASHYRIQIVDEQGQLARTWMPGSVAEQELITTITERVRSNGVGIAPAVITAITERVQSKGVGVGCTEAHVLADVRAACEEVLGELKDDIEAHVVANVTSACEEILFELKSLIAAPSMAHK